MYTNDVIAGKLDNAKKALEGEVRSLSVRIEEIESTALASSKRSIQKMEMRITVCGYLIFFNYASKSCIFSHCAVQSIFFATSLC